MLVFFFRSAFT